MAEGETAKGMQHDGMKRYGIFGGSFDPFHTGHLELCLLAKQKLGLSHVVLVPSFRPPHKAGSQVAFEKRVAMLRLLQKEHPFFVVDEVEKEMGPGNTYTYLMLPKVIEKYQKFGTPFFLMGSDSLKQFENWVEPRRIAAMCQFAVASRSVGERLGPSMKKLMGRFGMQITYLGACRNVSSSEVRARLELRYNPQNYLPNGIYGYIVEHELYQLQKNVVTRVLVAMDTEKGIHVQSTVVYAMRFARQLGLNSEDVFLACLLHDIAKGREPLRESYPTPSKKVIHQFDGKTVAEGEFGVTDPTILDAIEYHTTGKPAMTRLGQLVYLADKLEPLRQFEGINEIRIATRQNFDKGFQMLVARQYQYLLGLGVAVDDLTKEAYLYYNTK